MGIERKSRLDSCALSKYESWQKLGKKLYVVVMFVCVGGGKEKKKSTEGRWWWTCNFSLLPTISISQSAGQWWVVGLQLGYLSAYRSWRCTVGFFSLTNQQCGQILQRLSREFLPIACVQIVCIECNLVGTDLGTHKS